MKKMISFMIALALMLAFAACSQDNELAAYKNTARTTIQEYADRKVQTEYSAENWVAITEAVTKGKEAVGRATDKVAADNAVKVAERTIETVDKLNATVTYFEYSEVGYVFKLTVSVDKITAKLGDMIKITATFQNLSESGINISLLYGSQAEEEGIKGLIFIGLIDEGGELGSSFYGTSSRTEWFEKDAIIEKSIERPVRESINYNQAYAALTFKAFNVDDAQITKSITVSEVNKPIKIFIEE